MEKITWKTIAEKIRDGKKLDDAEKEWAVRKLDAYWERHPDVEHRFPRWKKILAWVTGHQYYDFNTRTRKIMNVAPLLDRERKLVFNRLKPFARTLLSKLCADVPQPGVVPHTDEYEDEQAAETGDQLLDGLSESLKFRVLDERIKNWLVLTNYCALRVFWNRDKYGVVDYAKEKKMDEVTGAETTVVEEIREDGDVDMEVVSPFNFRVDPLFADADKRRWFLYGDTLPADDIEEAYDLEEGSLVKEDKSGATETAYNLAGSDSGEFPTSQPERDEETTGRTTLYKEFWTKDFYMFTAGNKILEYGPNTLEEIPALVYEDRLVPTAAYDKGIVYNDGPLRDAIPVQREYNRSKSLVSTALERLTKFHVMVPLGSMISKKQVTNELGTFIDVNLSKGRPEPMRMGEIPAFMASYIGDLEREFETVMNAHEVSFGRLPERASHASGTLVSLLLEQDNAVLTPILTMVNNNHAKAWSLVLRLIRDNYDVARLVRYTGKDGQVAVGKFRGADLRTNTDVRITSQTGLPQSRALRVEYLMKLRESGLLKDDKLTLELMNFGNANKVFSTTLVHERKAYRENDRIDTTPAITPQDAAAWVYPYDDHGIHLNIHLRDMLSVKAENWQDAQRAALDEHIKVHQQYLQQQQAQAQQQAMAAQAQMGRQGGKQGPPAKEAGAQPTA